KADSNAQGFLASRFCDAIKKFERERTAYVDMFTVDNMEEYRENPGHFKAHLASRCPIIRKCLMNSKMRELMEWQQKFKYTEAAELADIFANVIEFAAEYVAGTDKAAYAAFDLLDDF